MITRYLAVGLFACMLSFSAQAQRTLETLVSDPAADWMFGQWQAETENGDPVSLTITWDLEKHVVVLHVKTRDMESKGFTVMEPKVELPRYYSFDNRGSVGKGSWNIENGELVLRVDTETPDRGPRKSALFLPGAPAPACRFACIISTIPVTWSLRRGRHSNSRRKHSHKQVSQL
jgi:hypothetical protein